MINPKSRNKKNKNKLTRRKRRTKRKRRKRKKRKARKDKNHSHRKMYKKFLNKQDYNTKGLNKNKCATYKNGKKSSRLTKINSIMKNN